MLRSESLMFCRLLILCGVLPGMSSLWSDAAASARDVASTLAGSVEKSEPDVAFGALEFRIAPQTVASRRTPTLITAEQLAQCRKDLNENGPAASVERDDQFVWLGIMEGVKLPEHLITEKHQGTEYLLVHNWPPFAMSSETGWGLQRITNTKDNVGRPAIAFQFDWQGGNLFYNLTSANIGESVAIVVGGRVVSAPNISAAIRSQGIITGDFTSRQINEITRVLRRIVGAVSTTKAPTARRSARTYLLPALVFVLAISVVAFLVYR